MIRRSTMAGDRRPPPSGRAPEARCATRVPTTRARPDPVSALGGVLRGFRRGARGRPAAPPAPYLADGDHGGDQDDDRDRTPREVARHLVQARGEDVAQQDAGAAPDDAADGVPGEERAQVGHAGHAGEAGDQGAEQRGAPTQEHRLPTVAVEELLTRLPAAGADEASEPRSL